LPIGLPYLAAVLGKSEHEVAVIDCEALGIDLKRLRAKLASLKPKVVGITSTTPTIRSALLSARVAKEVCPNAIVVLGGPHATFMDEQILSKNPEVDVIVRGEGEQTLVELVDTVFKSNTKHLHKVAGITFRKNGQIIRTPNRPLIENLDELPRPAYEHLPLKKYRLFGKSILPIMTSRGCPFQCAFCVSSRMGGIRFRARSPKSVADELDWLRGTYGADAFTFYDDVFTLDAERTLKICEEIKKRKIGLPWDCQTRVDRISKEVLMKMREAQCQLVSFGVESGSQQILDAVGKETTVEQNERAIRWAKEAGLSVSVSVILGYPGETTDTLRQTMDFIRKTKPDYVYLTLAMPYPGTALYNLLKDLGWSMSTDWSHYDLQTPVFESPLLPNDELIETRRKFYNDFYSPAYILRQSLKGNFYSRNMARTALNHVIWRTKLPKLVPAILRK
jgi:anaerobic magnesium-protoporphyrin IX monomethyl ester cyclase